jgi:hypothetical protein
MRRRAAPESQTRRPRKAQALLHQVFATAEELGLAGITAMCRQLQEQLHQTGT